jgi:predicted transcriptional regulator
MIKDEQMMFRVSSELKAEFQQAANAIDRPAAQVLREFMRTFVDRINLPEPAGSNGSTVAKRQAAMDYGRASVALEGLKPSAEGEAIQQRWVRGEISMDECIAAIKHRYQTATTTRDELK